MARRLVLASASPARRRLLESAGFAPEVMPSGVDEDGVDLADVDAATVALAERKACHVAPRAGDALVVGCDSLLELGGEALGKPVDGADARRRWRRMRGGQGRLVTGHAVVDGRTGAVVSAAASTTVRFGCPTDAEIDAYIDRGEPLLVAGSFTIDGFGAPFVEGVDGDPGNVVGLSLPLLRRLLARLDVEITDLWR